MRIGKSAWFWIIAAVLAGLCCLPFLRSAAYGLINLDDYAYIPDNLPVAKWQGWASVCHVFTDVSQSIWMPLTWLSYAADGALFGVDYGLFHIHSVLLHLANGVLVFAFLRELFAAPSGTRREEARLAAFCLIAALFWVVHPLRCESVVLLSSRKDVLSFFWEMLALLLWVRGGTWRTFAALFCFLIGATAKPSVMTFPALCLIVDLFIRREVRVWRYAVPLVLALGLAVFAGWQQKVGGATVDLLGEPLWGRALNAAAAFGLYLRNTVWPDALAAQCVNRWPELPRFCLPGVLVCAGWCWLCARPIVGYWKDRAKVFVLERWEGVPVRITCSFDRNPALAGLLWFILAIAPMLGLAKFGYHAFADRFTYIPGVGLSIVLVVLLSCAAEKIRFAPVAAVGVLALVALGVCSWRQTGYWENDRVLFRHTLEVDGDGNAAAHWVLAKYAFEFEHDLTTFEREFERTIELAPLMAMPNYDLCVLALCEQGRYDEAHEKIKAFDTLIERLFGRDYAVSLSAPVEGVIEPGPDTHLANMLRNMKKRLKLVYWTLTPGFMKSADALLAEENEAEMERYALFGYLLWKRAIAKGDDATRERLYRKLTDGSYDTGYLRFRFMQNKNGKHHRES